MVSSELLEEARKFHGHICPFLALGLRASEIALSKLNTVKAGVTETVMEDIIAFVEVNNCFSDGVQVATGCTLGNNSLVYIDLGKNAVTLVARSLKRGIRVYVDSEAIKSKYFSEEVLELFKRVVVEKVGSEEDVRRLDAVWSELGYKMAELPEDELVVQEVEVVKDLERAPIFESVRCVRCNELVMSVRASYVRGRPYCLSCVDGNAYAVVGRGIVKDYRIPYKVVIR